jgi:ectoine hydroxylase-related dioxygenase (phytanoyl-CoA dioxygenase family)
LRRNIPWFNFSDHAAEAGDGLDMLLRLAIRVPLKQGSVLLWDQTVMHGSAPNESLSNRMAQFVKAFPRACVDADRLARRSAALEILLRENGTDVHLDLCDSAKRMMGL